MSSWNIACVQMDCRFADKEHNLSIIRERLKQAHSEGAHLVIFPECAITGYAFRSKAEATPVAETIPGPSSDKLADACRQQNIWCIVGSLEACTESGDLFNVAMLIGPSGLVDVYRKIHLPYLGLDRFTTPGNKPFAMHDLGGLRVGMNICYDGSFPESSRCLTLLGADLVVLPTNWPMGAKNTAKFVPQTRAHENHIYYAACNRVGEERGVHFIGQSQIIDVYGEMLASAGEGEEILYAQITPERARNKHQSKIPGEYELHRIAQRRPEMYGELIHPVTERFVPSS